jgi:hypothetical protein
MFRDSSWGKLTFISSFVASAVLGCSGQPAQNACSGNYGGAGTDPCAGAGSTATGGTGGAASGADQCCSGVAEGSSGSPIQHSACNLKGWNVALGDSSSDAGVTDADISQEDVDTPECYTRLTADTGNRHDVVVHIIAYLPQTLVNSCSHNQELSYSFRVPDANSRGETVEGGLFSYGGLPDKLDHGMAWQWIVNEEDTSTFQHLKSWSTQSNPDGLWVDSGRTIVFDQAWHTLSLKNNFDTCTATLTIDGGWSLNVPLAHEHKADFGADITARAQVEAVSRWPGTDSTGGGRHWIDVKDWTWTLTPR